MKKYLSNSFLVFVVLFSFLTASLPQAGFAQTSAAAAASSADYSKQLQAIEEQTEARRKEFGIPGMSLVIVKDEKIIYAKGFGYKDFENKVPVTADTQFPIGSATKAFTALTVLMSQDEGKLSLDDSPKKALPYFKMYDPDTDKNITIRDLLSHSSGLNRTDLAMITGKLTRAELIQVAAQAKPTAKLREKFQYQNIMFAAAGEIVATVQKTPWEKFVPARIFKPLGMRNSTMSIGEMQKAKDFSFGYNYNFDTKETKKLPFREITQVAPAGSINSSANDMAQWLRFVLNGGTVSGKRLVSEKGYEEWTKPQMKVAGNVSYGFGWFIQDWNGLKVIQHGGNIDGFNSMVAMIPEKKLGFVMLTNVSSSSLGNDLMPIVWKNILGDPNAAEAAKLTAAEMAKLAGTYQLAEANLDVEVKADGGKLVMTVPGQPPYTLERTGERQFKPAGLPDGFSVKFSPAAGDASELELTQPGKVSKLKRRGTSDAGQAADSSKTNPARDLIGKYAIPGGSGNTIEVRDDGGKVTFNIAGQQPYELIEKSKDTFSMSPLPDAYSLKAKRDAAGKVESVAVTQPEGTFEFKRADTSAEKKIAMTADELHAWVIQAAGGEANLRKVTSRVVESDIDLENQGVKATSISYAKAPNKGATETTFIALGKTIGTGWEFFDGTGGESAYSFSPAEKLTGKSLDDARLSADIYSLLDWKTAFKQVEITGMGKVGDEDAYIVSFVPQKGSPYKEYYSTKTFLLLRRVGVIVSSTSSQQLPYAVVFSDYRDVDGVKLPFKSVNNSISNGDVVSTVRSIKQNVPIDDTLFAPRKLN